MERRGGDTAPRAAEAAQMQLYQQQAAHWKARAVAAQYENKILRHILDQQFKLAGSQLFKLPEAFKRPASKELIPKTPPARPYREAFFSAQSTKSKAPVAGCSGDFRPEEIIEDQYEELGEDDDEQDDDGDDEELEEESYEESDNESIEFEMSGEFKRFLEVNRKHKEDLAKERERLRNERGSESDSEVIKRMEQPPTDDDSQLREKQLRLLYGERWKQIEGLETYVRMKYDQFCDRNKPEYWPNIPLKL